MDFSHAVNFQRQIVIGNLLRIEGLTGVGDPD